MNACSDDEKTTYSVTLERVVRVCRDFIDVFFDRVSKDSSGAFDTIDLEKAREESHEKLHDQCPC